MNKIKKYSAVILMCIFVLSFAACGEEKKTYSVEGSWKTENGKITEITFNEDGTGSLKKGSEISVNFTYVIAEDKLTVTTEILNQKTDTVYTYTVSADALTLTNGSDTAQYKKQ